METVAEVLAVYSAMMGVYSLIGIALYVLQALGFYTIAQRRGIEHAWLAWIPVGCLWILGAISDDFQLKTQGLVRNRRKILLILSLVMVLTAILMFGAAFGMAFGMLMDSGVSESQAVSAVIPVVVSYLVLIVVAVMCVVFQYICLYNLFASCDPNNKVPYLVLSIFISGLSGILIFVCRNKDLGMYPAPRQIPYGYGQPPYGQPYQQYQPPQYQPPQYQPPQYQPPQYQPPQYQPPQCQPPQYQQPQYQPPQYQPPVQQTPEDEQHTEE